jgi:hypothetical protein
MSLSERLTEYIEACFTGLWIQSHEHEDALAELARLCHERQWRLAVWDIERGLQLANGAADDTASTDPLAAIRSINSLATPDSAALLVMVNFHRFTNSAEIVQTMARQINAGKQNRTFLVVLSPIVQIPNELEKQIIVLEHDLPDRGQLEEIARGIATNEEELPAGDGLVPVLDAAVGLTRYEAEGAFSLSLVRHNRIEPTAIWELKSQMLKKSGLLSLHRGNERFDDLGGLASLKSFCSRAMRRQGNPDPLKRPRGVLLLGVPGTGKSAFAKSLGNETGRPTLAMDIGALLGSLVGQSEANIRHALKIADAMAPSILFIDEVEKALSGVGNSGQSDGGVSMRLFGTFLTWLSDHASDVFVVATCNNIAHLPPEFARAERFDGVFFLDLPDAGQRRAIWDLYVQRFGLAADQQLPADAEWTGAEIRACCRLAALLDVPLIEAGQNVVPVSRTASESVSQLREWASGRCLSADHKGLYRFGGGEGGGGGKRRRSIPRDPSVN